MAVAVVIPFFQKTEGLLARAIGSVRAQRDAGDVRVVVVDDSSPVPAEAEVARLAPDARVPVTIVRQANAGPAAARNRGLDTLGDDVRHVAFLDSDDTWSEGHLAHARAALADHDFYFADHYQPGQTVSAFRRAGRIDLDAHPRLAVGDGTLHDYRGDMFDQVMRGNLIGTSTVVYDFARFRTQRFDEAFYSAGEDYLFWIACARAGARFAFSSEVEVSYGYGVNLYAGSGWGTEGYLLRIQNEMRYRKKLLDFDLSPSQRAFVGERIAKLREEFAGDVVHRVSHRKPLSTKLLRDQAVLDWRTLLMLPIHAGQFVAKQVRK